MACNCNKRKTVSAVSPQSASLNIEETPASPRRSSPGSSAAGQVNSISPVGVTSNNVGSTNNIDFTRKKKEFRLYPEILNLLNVSDKPMYPVHQKVDFLSKIEIEKAFCGETDVTDQIKDNMENLYYLIFSFNRVFTSERESLKISYKYNDSLATKTFNYEDTVCIPAIQTRRLAIVLDGPFLKETLRMIPDNIWPIVITEDSLKTQYFKKSPLISTESSIYGALLLAKTITNFSEVFILKDGAYPEEHFYSSGGISINRNIMGFFEGFFKIDKNLSFIETLKGDFESVFDFFESLYKKSLIQIPFIPELDTYSSLTDVPSQCPILMFSNEENVRRQETIPVWNHFSSVQTIIDTSSEKAW